MKNYHGFKMKDIIIFLKENGFIYQGSEIYGGLANSWDYGPLGVKLKQKIKNAWWNYFLKNSNWLVPIDSSILLNPKVWLASGHLEKFNDPLIDCKNCKSRFRADNLIEHYFPDINCDGMEIEQLEQIINQKTEIVCLKCQEKDFTKVRQFQLMFETYQGTVQNQANKLYLRPETAQGIFINFNNIKNISNKKLPFGIGQIGKSFRNEVTPGNFIFRTLEFEQMEIEFFFSPSDKNNWYQFWVDETVNFIKLIGIDEQNFEIKAHEKHQLSHYALETCDIKYQFPFGTKELCGIANRGNYDLSQHSQFSQQKLTIEDPISKKPIIPYVIEPSMGVERLLLAVICDALKTENNADKERTILKLSPLLVPFHVAVSSLHKNKLNVEAKAVYELLKHSPLDVAYEEKPNIGRVYNYHDSIGTLFCVTIDYDTVNDQSVTVRHRDTMVQTRLPIVELKKYLINNINLWAKREIFYE